MARPSSIATMRFSRLGGAAVAIQVEVNRRAEPFFQKASAGLGFASFYCRPESAAHRKSASMTFLA